MKNFTQKIILTAWMTFVCLPVVFAQSRSVTGQVRDAKTGEPLVGVSVVVANTTTGTSTGADGTYSITTPQGGGKFTLLLLSGL